MVGMSRSEPTRSGFSGFRVVGSRDLYILGIVVSALSDNLVLEFVEFLACICWSFEVVAISMHAK